MTSPIVCPTQEIEETWIDYNGHLNMAFYNLLFDRSVDHVFDQLGIGADYVQNDGGSVFTMEIHVTYGQELTLDDPVQVTWQLLDWDEKRLHFFQKMYHAEKNYLAATSEQLALHVDMSTRRAAPFPDVVQQRIDAMMKTHAGIPRAEEVGRVIGIRRR